MKISIENIKGLRHRINLTISANIIEQEFKTKLLNLKKMININGFRKGKVPFDIITQRYGNSIRHNLLKDLMKRNFINIILSEKINLLNEPHYISGNYKINEDFNYSVEFYIQPEIQLNNLNIIKIERPMVEIKNTDIDHMLETIREQHAQWKSTTDIATLRDQVTIDFIGYIDGKECEKNKATNFTFPMGQGLMAKDFEEGIIGHKSGEHFSVKVKLSKNLDNKDKKIEIINFNIFLKKVEQRKVPDLNAEFIKRFGIIDGSIEKLRIELNKHMKRELKKLIRYYLKNQIMHELINIYNIDIPSILIDYEVKILKNQILQYSKENKKQIFEIPSDFLEQQAKARLKFNFLSKEIIRKNNLIIDTNLVNILIKEIASAYDNPQEVILLYNKNKKLINHVRQIALEEQIIEIILDNARVIEKKISFTQLMNQLKKYHTLLPYNIYYTDLINQQKNTL